MHNIYTVIIVIYFEKNSLVMIILGATIHFIRLFTVKDASSYLYPALPK